MREYVVFLCDICKNELELQFQLVEINGKEQSGRCELCGKKKYLRKYRVKNRSRDG